MKFIDKLANLFLIFIGFVAILVLGTEMCVIYIQESAEPEMKLLISRENQAIVFNIDPSKSMYLTNISVQKINNEEYLWDVDLRKNYKIIKYGEVIFDKNNEVVKPRVIPGNLNSQMEVKVRIGYHYQDIAGAVSKQKTFIERIH